MLGCERLLLNSDMYVRVVHNLSCGKCLFMQVFSLGEVNREGEGEGERCILVWERVNYIKNVGGREWYRVRH